MGSASRTVVSGPDANGNLVLREIVAGETTDTAYRVTADGLFLTDPLGPTAPPGVRQIVGTVLEYPQPFYAVGQTRKAIRQGAWDEDLDGDGHPEGFRAEFSQVFRGFESLVLPNGPAQTARFTNTLTFTITPSRLTNMAVTVTSTEEAWFASNIGLVRAERSAVSSAGSVTFTPYTLAITGGTVNGLPLFTAPPDGTVTNVPLAHSALVYDSVHDRYYASIPGSVAVNGNSIATIDPRTGAVTYSAPVGSDPGPLAVSADGSVLHVGLKGAGSVVKLSLPSMTVLGAVALPVANFFGQLYAESLTVSPVDPTVLAVSTYRAGVSPRHGGVALIRDMVLQPVMTQDHTGSNLVAFGVAGTEVFGLNTETTEFGLRRISVLANGLAEQQVVPNAISTFGLQTLEAVGASVVVGQRVYRASDLALLGTVAADGGGCRALPSGTRVVCLSGGFGAAELRLAVADLATFVVQSRPLVNAGPLNLVNFQLVPGPSGQVAIRDNAGFFDAPSTRIFLFTSALLQ